MSEEGKALIIRFIDVVWRQGRLDRLGEFWTDDCVNHADTATPNAGLPALRLYHERFGTAFAGFSDMDIRIVQQVADGAKVVTHMVTGLRHSGPFNGVKATGRTVSLQSMRIDRIAGSKITEHWSVGDLAGLMQQLQG